MLVVQVPHTPKTEKMIGAPELDLLGKGSILVNCRWGPVVDQQALIHKLDPEPLAKDSVLRRLPNAFVTPHIAWFAPMPRAVSLPRWKKCTNAFSRANRCAMN